MNGLLTARHLPVAVSVDTDVLSVTNHLFSNRVCRDRFNLLNRFCNIRFDLTKADPFPVPTEKSIESIIDETAQRLIAENEHITAMWSGGVDSTCMVAALVYNGVSLDRFVVVCSNNSIKESPYFYDFLLQRGVTCVVTNDIIATIGDFETDCIVNGCCADQLFGHMIHRKNAALYNLEWHRAIDKIYNIIHLPLSSTSLEYLCEHWKHYAHALELEVTQFCEWAWLYNFGIRWSLIEDSVPLQFAHAKNKDKFYAFYSGYDFQCWSVGNFENIKKYNQIFDARHYKVPLKEYTYKVTQDNRCFLVGKHVSNIVEKKKESSVVVRESDCIKIYNGVDYTNYDRAGIAIGNQYRKHQVLL